MEEQAIMQLKATNGTVLVYDDRVVIRRTGMFALATQGIKGDTVFFYHTLSGIDYKKPGLFNGYLRFVTAGTLPYVSQTGWFSSPQDQLNDPNTVVLRAFNSRVPAQSEEIYNFILKKINEYNSKPFHEQYKSNIPVPTNNFSGADEIAKYKRLYDEGVITYEDFERKKRQILNM